MFRPASTVTRLAGILRRAAATAAFIATAWLSAAACAQPIPTRPGELPRYDMRIDYQPAREHFGVSGTVTLPAAPHARGEVELSLAEAMGDAQFSLLASGGAPSAATVEKIARPTTSRRGWGVNTWRIRTPAGFPAGKPVVLRFSYAARGEIAANLFYAGPGLAFGTGVLSAWYPELEREPVGRDGALRGLRGTGRLTFAVPRDVVVFANGKEGPRRAGIFEYRFDSPIFFAFAAGRYRTAQRPGAVPATAYLLERRPSTDELLRKSQRIVDLLSREFHPYPYAGFAVVEIPSEIAHKAGFDGACLEGFIYATTEFLEKPFNTAFFAHEIGHQWWPYMLGPDSGEGNYLLTDAMVNFAALRAVEMMEGAAAAERFRRTGHPAFYPEFSGTGFLQLAAAGMEVPLAASHPPSHPDGRLSFSLVGSKGMLVWDMLSREIGRETFSATLRTLITQNFYQRLPIADFRRKFSVAAGVDLSWFFEQWLDRTGAPEPRLEWRRSAETIEGRITQAGTPYRLSLPIEIVREDGQRERRTLRVEGRETRFSWAVAGPVRTVEIDPRFEILRWTDEYRAEAQALIPYTKANMALVGPGAETAIPLFRAGLAGLREADRHGVGFLLHYGLADALFSTEQYGDAWREADAALASPSRRIETVPLVHLLRARIAQRQGNAKALADAIRDVRAADAATGGTSGALAQALALAEPRN